MEIESSVDSLIVSCSGAALGTTHPQTQGHPLQHNHTPSHTHTHTHTHTTHQAQEGSQGTSHLHMDIV